MILWISLGVTMTLLFLAWERSDRVEARAEQLQRERDELAAALLERISADLTQRLRLPSGREVEVYEWPTSTAGYHPEMN